MAQTGGRDGWTGGESKVLQEVLADLKTCNDDDDGDDDDDDGDYFDQGMPRQLQTSSGPDLLQTSHSSLSNSPKCQNVGNKTNAATTIKISF